MAEDGYANGHKHNGSAQLLLPNLVDELASTRPDTVWAKYPNSPSTYELGFSTVTYHQLAHGIDGAAWWLRQTLGTVDNFPTLAYIGSNDLRYPLLVLGAIKAGFKVSLCPDKMPLGHCLIIASDVLNLASK